MNAPYDSSKQRIELLERKLESLQRKLDQGFDRSQTPQLYPRLATTFDNGSYPTDPAKVYPIVFMNGTFTEVAGNGSATFTNRSSTSKRVGYGLTGDYIPSGTVVAAWRQNNRWWILPTGAVASSSQSKIGKVINGPVAPGAAATVRIWRRSTPASAPSQVSPIEDVSAVHDWMTGSKNLTADQEVKIEFFEDENVWRVTGATC